MERRKNPPAFIKNTYNILEVTKIKIKREDLNSIISWSPDGSGFIIYDLGRFEGEILPQYFKHKKFTSFVRQV